MKRLLSLIALPVALGCGAAQAQYTDGVVKIGVTFFDIVAGSPAFENDRKSIKRARGCGAMAISFSGYSRRVRSSGRKTGGVWTGHDVVLASVACEPYRSCASPGPRTISRR